MCDMGGGRCVLTPHPFILAHLTRFRPLRNWRPPTAAPTAASNRMSGEFYLKQQYSSFSITVTLSFKNRVLNPAFLRMV
jgi:hypothetical protein